MSSETFLVVAGAALLCVALVGGFLARWRGGRPVDAGSVSASWLARANWEREE